MLSNFRFSSVIHQPLWSVCMSRLYTRKTSLYIASSEERLYRVCTDVYSGEISRRVGTQSWSHKSHAPIHVVTMHHALLCLINQTINILFYVCSRRGDIRHKNVLNSGIQKLSLSLFSFTSFRSCVRVKVAVLGCPCQRAFWFPWT